MRRLLSPLMMLAVLSVACGGGPSGPTGSPSAPASSTPEPSATASASPSPSIASPSASPRPAFALDTVVRAAVENLRVRDEPSLAGAVLGTLPEAAQSIVLDGPVAADGHEWYFIGSLGLSMATGCEGPIVTTPFGCPFWYGWVAAAGLDGSPWLVGDAPACPDWPDGRIGSSFVFGVQRVAYLVCFGADERSLVGWYPVIPEDAGLGGACDGPDSIVWLSCNLGYEHLVIEPSEEFGTAGFPMVLAPGLTMPERGQFIEITGHYDDPAARDCDFGDIPQASVLTCRTEFVVTAARAVTG
jgi:hypothetical protein